MEIFEELLQKTTDLLPTVVAIAVLVIVVWAVRLALGKRYDGSSDHRFRVQVVTMVLAFVGLLVVILTLPLSESTIGQLLGLIGILLSATIALSATTFLGNIMAGLMLRAIKNFRAGDFVRVGEHFGRVSARGLFHIEIQTEDRDLTTLPNLYLVTNPVKVVRSSGTLVTADISLGYDVPRSKVEGALLKAAVEAGLAEPFVHVMELGNYAITYRLAGLLTEVKHLLSTRSSLRAMMVDNLHQAGVEIVSPTFMNQRVVGEDRVFIPKIVREPVAADKQSEGLPEEVVFDKADEAESLENLRERQTELRERIEELKGSLSEAEDEAVRAEVEGKIEVLEKRLARLSEYVEEREG